jgi:hypothetical protein
MHCCVYIPVCLFINKEEDERVISCRTLNKHSTGQAHSIHIIATIGYGTIHSYWGRILGRNPGKSLKSFPPCYSQSQLCLEISLSRNLLQFQQFVAVHCKGERRKPDSKPYPLPYSLIRNPYRNLKSEKSQDYAQKPQRNRTFMNSATDVTKPRAHMRLVGSDDCMYFHMHEVAGNHAPFNTYKHAKTRGPTTTKRFG